MRNKFDEQLHLLDEQLTHMGELCETAIAKATQALKDGSAEQARVIISEDEEIDQSEKDIERLCLKLLLQQQPVAKDLRRISAALKMITDMERIGDQTADIAEIILSSKKWAATAENIQVIGTMASEVSKMVRNSVTAYVNRDLELARDVMKADDEIDLYFDEVKDEAGLNGDIVDITKIKEWAENAGYDIDSLGDPCTIISPSLKNLLTSAFWIISVGGIILVVVMTAISFIKAIVGSEDDKFRDAIKHLYTRIIVIIILLLLPMILTFIINLINNAVGEGKVSIGSNGNDVFCDISN